MISTCIKGSKGNNDSVILCLNYLARGVNKGEVRRVNRGEESEEMRGEMSGEEVRRVKRGEVSEER